MPGLAGNAWDQVARPGRHREPGSAGGTARRCGQVRVGSAAVPVHSNPLTHTAIPAQAAANRMLRKVPMMNRSAAPVELTFSSG